MTDNIYSQIAEYKPEFLYNDKKSIKVLTEIEKELSHCDKFKISVAFITQGGIEPLLPVLKKLEENNIQGQILTTDYLIFSNPKALRKLHEFKNLEIRMYMSENQGEGFHTKGYIFEEKEIYHIVVGSSNLTQTALTSNKEWNIKINSTKNHEITHDILNEFESMWNSNNTKEFESFIDLYEERYKQKKRIQAVYDEVYKNDSIELKPNSMQTAFIDNLNQIVLEGKDKALLISATGTGKTYASAFAMKHFNFKRVLFLVHRNQLATQAKNSYKKVFGDKIKTGIIGNGKFENDADYIFGTVNTIYKSENLSKFKPNDFDCIIIDEAHHSCANMYQTIMQYFKPKLWLGMTATPDRVESKNQENIIYKLFDYQIAYEIRLQQAMQQNLLCPFHYFGISDLKMVDDKAVDEDTEISFNQLTSDERVRHIIKMSNFYGFSGNRVKGLIFCNRIEVAKVLSDKFNQLGYNTVSLDASNSEEERQEAFDLLATDEEQLNDKKHLDYIFSVNLLNEGVDIIEVNQVIMLRRTESPVVFLQQLGRGLRKHNDKEYVVVLDFIGNYKTNFVIPIALSGDRTYNKDNIRRFIAEGSNIIPGSSTIHFDEISQQRIYKALDDVKFNEARFIKDKYQSLKSKIGRIPTMKDFEDYGEIDVMHIVEHYKSYIEFLLKCENEYTIKFSDIEREMICYISNRFMWGKRPNELELFNTILDNKEVDDIFHIYVEKMQNKYQKVIDEIQKQNLINLFTAKFETGGQKKSYQHCIFLEKDASGYRCASKFKQLLGRSEFLELLEEIIKFGLARYQKEYTKTYKDTDLVLNKKYTYYDVCQLLNWKENIVPLNIGGYKYDEYTNTFPVFINYEKSDDISDSIKYEDRFINRERLISISKPKRNIASDDVQNFIHSKDRGIKVELFVRKNKDDKDESKQFYFLGELEMDGEPIENIRREVELPWKLDVPVREDIYDYIVNK